MTTIIGGDGPERLAGRDEADFIDGRGGNDNLRGRSGNDTLMGGTGDDFLESGWGADLLDGGDGVDLAGYSAAIGGVRIDLGAGAGLYDIAHGDVLANVENVVGSAFNDTLAGDAGRNELHGIHGNDFLNGRGGRDTLYGSYGDDILKGGGGNDRFEYFLTFENPGADRILDFVAGAGTGDVIRIYQFSGTTIQDFADVLAASTQVGGDTFIDFGNGRTITLVGVDMTTLSADDFSFRFLLAP